jgi:outer membrane protein OmpA-like peptidoglycan-associated protein
MTKSKAINIFILFILLCAGIVHAQNISGIDLLSEKMKSRYETAKKESRAGKYASSLKLYEEILEKYPAFTAARIRKASVLQHLKRYESAVSEYITAISEDPDFDPEMYFSFALLYQEMKQYGKASEQFEQFLLREKDNNDRILKARQFKEITDFRHYAMSNPVEYKPEKLEGGINTKYSEYTPSISLDGNTIVFTRRTGGQEDLYMSTKINGTFSEAFALDELNTHRNEGAHCISSDGKTLIFTACDRTDSYGGCDLYYSVNENGKWSRPFNMGKRVNTPAYDSQPCLTADGRTLYFSSNRTGGLGGKDIWVTHLDEENRWSVPVNVGPAINSEGNDETPFIHADGMTLYFRSDGRLGMGGYDIYFSRLDTLSDAWTDAVNIGYPINSERSEGGLIISMDGATAYFASDMEYIDDDPKANLDIYSFNLPAGVRPMKATFVRGLIRDKSSELPLVASISIIDLSSNKTLYKSLSDINGTFISGMAAGKNYACIVEKNGYLLYSKHFDLTDIPSDQYYELDIRLQALTLAQDVHSNQAVVLENIFFDSGTATLKPESTAEINKLADFMQKHPTTKIRIIGHTDNVGNEYDNKLLSENRAKAVMNALLLKGVDQTRLDFQGLGESSPVDSNETEAGRKRNRRTEFVIIDQ